MAGEGDDTDDSDDPSTLGDGESQAGGSGGAGGSDSGSGGGEEDETGGGGEDVGGDGETGGGGGEGVEGVEGDGDCGFVDFCLFVFCMHRYHGSLILGLRFLRATNETLLLFLFVSSAVRFD